MTNEVERQVSSNADTPQARSLLVYGQTLERFLMAIDEDVCQLRPDVCGSISGAIPRNFDSAARAFCKRQRLIFERDSEFELRLSSGNYYLVCSHGIDC